MTEPLDPELQILFANADDDLPGDSFVETVLAGLVRDRRRRRVRRIAIAAAVVALLWLFHAPLQEFGWVAMQALGTNLLPPGDGLAMQFLAPLNNVAGLLALGLLALQVFLRRA